MLLGDSAEKPKLETVNYENLSNIVEPIAKDSASQINIATLNINGAVHFNLNSLKSNAAQNAVKRALDAMKTRVTGMHSKVLLYWYQARNDLKSQSGDKAIIESIFHGPVKAIYANETIKAKILSSSENPFTMAYVVDVAVETIQDRPVMYRILEMHDHFERDDIKAIRS